MKIFRMSYLKMNENFLMCLIYSFKVNKNEFIDHSPESDTVMDINKKLLEIY